MRALGISSSAFPMTRALRRRSRRGPRGTGGRPHQPSCATGGRTTSPGDPPIPSHAQEAGVCQACTHAELIRAHSGSFRRMMVGSTSLGTSSTSGHLRDSVARPENPGVGSSILPLSTISFQRLAAPTLPADRGQCAQIVPTVKRRWAHSCISEHKWLCFFPLWLEARERLCLLMPGLRFEALSRFTAETRWLESSNAMTRSAVRCQVPI